MFGLAIFMYKRDLFINPKAFRVIFIISLIMLALAYILPQFDTFKNTPVNIWKLPIISLLLYRILRCPFKKAFNREPKNTFWMMHLEKDIWQNTVFNLLFSLFGQAF
jgi:hypothetical protein